MPESCNASEKSSKIDILRDEKIVPNFGILLGVTFGLYATSDMFMLVFFRTRFTVVISSVFLLFLGYFEVLAIFLDKTIRKRRKAKIKLGFNKQKLPSAIIDFILSGLMFFLANLVGSLKVLLYLIGFLFLAVAVLSLIVKPRRDFSVI